MVHKIEVIEDTQIIKVTYELEVTLDERMSVVHKLCTEFNKFPTFRLLLDSRKAYQRVSSTEQVIFGRYLSSRDEFNVVRVAILDDHEQLAYDNDIALVKDSSKLTFQVMQFADLTDAITWLND